MSRDRAEDESVQSWLQDISIGISRLEGAVFPQDERDTTIQFERLGKCQSLSETVGHGFELLASSIDKLTAAVEALVVTKKGRPQ